MSTISTFILAIALALPVAAQDRTVKFLDDLTPVMAPLVTVVTAPQVFSGLRYDPFADFGPVAHAASFLPES